jgi:hypothetical protein
MSDDNYEFDKQQAEELAAEADKKEEQHAEATGESPMPKVDFSTFIMSLASSALVHLGEVPDPETGNTNENLTLAKHTIDILAMLKEKTEKCLDEDEKRLIDGLLYEMRMKYVMKVG